MKWRCRFVRLRTGFAGFAGRSGLPCAGEQSEKRRLWKRHCRQRQLPTAWAEQIGASLHAERDSVRKFLAAQQTRLERAEVTLEELIARFEEAAEDAAAAAASEEPTAPTAAPTISTTSGATRWLWTTCAS